MDTSSVSSAGERPNERAVEVISLDGQLVNPFQGKTHANMLDLTRNFLQETALEPQEALFRRAAFLAQSPNAFTTMDRPDGLSLDPEERKILFEEGSDPRSRWSKWRQTPTLYAMIVCCSIGAAVQVGNIKSRLSASEAYYL